MENRAFPSLRRVPLNTKSIVVGDLTMTNHKLENGRRNFLLTIAGGIAGLAAGSWPARVLSAAGRWTYAKLAANAQAGFMSSTP